MAYHYVLVKQELYNTDVGSYIGYGIGLENNTDVFVGDIRSDLGFVSNIAAVLNKYQVAPAHLFDVIEDMLS